MTCTGGGVNVRVGRLEGRGQYSSRSAVETSTSAAEGRYKVVRTAEPRREPGSA